jgi:trehalose-phosphatase
MTVQILPIPADVEPRLTGVPLILLLDIDGTLAPIARTPRAAAVPAATERLLDRFAASAETHVALVTGRSVVDARDMVATKGIWIIGNHGAELRSPDGEISVEPSTAEYGAVMADAVAELERVVPRFDGVFVENKRWTVSVHYRMAEPSVVPALQSAFEDVVARRGLLMSEGKKIFDMKPPVNVNKGTAVMALARRLLASSEAHLSPSIIFAGDDITDEDAFKQLREHVPAAVTVRVTDDATAPTDAEFRVRNTDELRDFLECLATLRGVD